MNTYGSKPVPDDTLIFDLHPSRFLRPEDLLDRWKVQSVALTISRMAYEETIPVMADIDPQTRKPRVKIQPVLYFKTKAGDEFPRGLLLGAAENIASLRAATGVLTAGELVGKRITIKIAQHKGKPVLRISPEPAPSQVVTDAPKSNGKSSISRLEDLKAMAQTDVITAFSELCNAAGIDQPTRTAILKECGGDFAVAFERTAEQYKEILS